MTRNRSPGVSSAAFRAQSPDLRFASLMDTDFAVSCPLVRRSRLVPGVCPSTRTFATRFLRTPPRGGSPCVLASPSPPSGWAEDFHLQTAEHAQHTTKPLARRRLLGCVLVGLDRGSFGRRKEFFCDRATTTHAGRTPAAQFRSKHDPLLHPDRSRLRCVLP